MLSDHVNDSRGRGTLWEYLKPGSRREPLSSALLPLWRNRVAGNDHKVFKRRLQLAGFDVRELPRVFGAEGDAPARDARMSLAPIITRAESAGTSRSGEARRQENAAILNRILVTITERYLGADAGALDETVGRLGVTRSLVVSSLYQRLGWLSERLFLHEFKRFKSNRVGRTVRSLLGAFSGEENDRLATEFLEALHGGGLHELSAQYPVWCRLIEHEVERWGSVSLELIERLGADRAAIASVFRIDPSDPVVEIQSGGDTHRGGRRVEILTFKSGAKIVYKPRSVCLDVWYAELLTWLSGEPGVSLSLSAPRALDRGNYGWCEFIDHQGTNDPEAITRFYQRTGMLLGLWTVCGGSDGHFENLIARGEYPFMIDTETLFNGYGVERRIRGARGGSASAECFSRLLMSVKRVGLLPEYLKPNEDTDAFDMSAIGARTAWSSPFEWSSEEARDRVSLGMVPEVRPTTRKINTPAPIEGVLGESRIRALECGFEEIYTVLMREKRAFRRRIRNLQKEPSARVRVVLRSTHLYARLLSETLSPECLRDGVRRSIEIDRLSIKYTKGERSPCVEGILAAEIAAFESLDIPLFDVPFHTVGRSRVQCSLDGALSATETGSPCRFVLERLGRMSAEDLGFQRRLINEILFIDDALKLRGATGSGNRNPSELIHAAPSTAAMERMIAEIDRTLRETAVVGCDGSVHWIAPQSVAEGGFYTHGPIGAGLWEGSEGVALFYGALYRTTRDARHREFGLRCVETLHRAVLESNRRGRTESGLLSHAYVIERAAELLEAPALRGAIDTAIGRADLRFIGRDEKFDIMGGSAGMILGLAASSDADRDEDRLRLMRAAGDHLLKKRIISSSGARVWQTADAPLTGFAHGMAGIALSLVRLGVLLDESKYIEAAAEAIEYERALFDPAHGNWADLRHTKKSTEPSYVSTAWCHGATGIGLAYLAIEELGASLGLSHDIERARATTIGYPLTPNDTVCCGVFSRISLLDRLARYRGDTECGSWRDTLVSDVLNRSLHGVRALNHVDHFIPAPGFFNGISGIGYELIRLYLDRSLPNVHLFEGSSRH